jgi:hypothetical protein
MSTFIDSNEDGSDVDYINQNSNEGTTTIVASHIMTGGDRAERDE